MASGSHFVVCFVFLNTFPFISDANGTEQLAFFTIELRSVDRHQAPAMDSSSLRSAGPRRRHGKFLRSNFNLPYDTWSYLVAPLRFIRAKTMELVQN